MTVGLIRGAMAEAAAEDTAAAAAGSGAQPPPPRRFLIVGFPRSAEHVDGWFASARGGGGGGGAEVLGVLHLDAFGLDAPLEARLLERGRARAARGELSGADCTATGARRRAAQYADEGTPVLAAFARLGLVRAVSALASPPAVAETAARALDEMVKVCHRHLEMTCRVMIGWLTH